MPAHSSTARAAAACAALVLASPASADVVVEAEAAVRLGHVRSSPADTSASHLEAHPSLTLHFGSPQLVWRARYLFGGMFTFQGEGTRSYANQLELSLAATPTERSTLFVAAYASQGSTTFRLSQRTPEAAAPALRPPGSEAQVAGSLLEGFFWEAAPGLRLGQTLGASMSAPQDELRRSSWVATGVLSAERTFVRDSFGASFTSRFAELRPLLAPDGGVVQAQANSLLASWNRDVDQHWNGQLSAGFEHVTARGVGVPASLQPAGSLAVRYLAGKWVGTLLLRRGAAANLEEGTMSLADEVVLRASHTLDLLPRGTLSASAGYLHSLPLRAVGAASGAGDALQGDLALAWDLWGPLQASVRYSLDYQFGRAGNESATHHILLGGIVVRYTTGEQIARPVPTRGGRVDGGDGVGFPGAPRP